MDFLKKFNTETQYDADVENLEYATVSYIEDIEEVRYMKKYIPNYSEQYLTFEALEDGTFTLSISADVDSTCMTSVSYSTDDGETWTTTTVDNTAQTITTPTITQGNKVLWKGVGKQMSKNSTNSVSNFSATCNFNANGNIMSLLYGEDFVDKTTFPTNSSYTFCYLFSSDKLINANNLILPATTMTSDCYDSMFRGCTALTTAPELPAITLATACYYNMFQGCTSLTTAPELPATTLATACYNSMFNGCTSLTTAPELPATTLAEYCCGDMFNGCTSLTTAPELPATTLAYSCYSNMFYGCTSLTTAPELPATTLTNNCYISMFNGCTSLTTAPELPATTLTSGCYNEMFRGCSRLNYIKAMFTTTPSSTYTAGWVDGVAATGTFVKNSAATWDETGASGIPSGWTVETASE